MSDDVAELTEGLRRDISAQFREINGGDEEKPVLLWRESDGDGLQISERLNYRSGAYAFGGRDSEVAFLDHFLDDRDRNGQLEKFRWLLISGEGGEGKSRLRGRCPLPISGPDPPFYLS